jgi:hypothetical protein
MFHTFKRIVTAATIVAAVSAPSASARFIVDPPLVANSGSQLAAPVAPAIQHTSASPTQDFQWGDAAVGAAGALVLVGAGAGAALSRRRRAHQPLTS